MVFNDDEHLNRIRKFEDLWSSLVPLSKMAENMFNIDDIFQDNDGKVAQQLIILGFENLDGREGNDGKDVNGVEWEMKSVNVNKTHLVSTHHHLNSRIIEKYRRVPWSFSFYKGVELMEIYVVHPNELDKEYFSMWQKRYEETGKELNNPKINEKFIKEKGIKVYDGDKRELLVDPIEIYDDDFKKENLAFDFSSENNSYKFIAEKLISKIKELVSGVNIQENSEQNRFEFMLEETIFSEIEVKTKSINVYLQLEPDIDFDENRLKRYKKNKKSMSGEPAFNSCFKISSKKIEIEDIVPFITSSLTYSLEKKKKELDLLNLLKGI